MFEVLIGLDEVRRWSNRTFEPDEKGARESRSNPGEPAVRVAPPVFEARSPQTPRTRATLLQRMLRRSNTNCTACS